ARHARLAPAAPPAARRLRRYALRPLRRYRLDRGGGACRHAARGPAGGGGTGAPPLDPRQADRRGAAAGNRRAAHLAHRGRPGGLDRGRPRHRDGGLPAVCGGHAFRRAGPARQPGGAAGPTGRGPAPCRPAGAEQRTGGDALRPRPRLPAAGRGDGGFRDPAGAGELPQPRAPWLHQPVLGG
ncbi:MAG: hypothetical protein AVDCRST_MAG27-4042, partial [uncultured Craurococcus sp.]